MSNEITLSIRASISNANLRSVFDPGPQQFTQTTQGLHAPVVIVGTSEEDFDPGDVAAATQGILCMRNLDTTNFVKYGPKSAGSMIEFGRIKAGEIQTFRLAPSIVMRWIADTSACNVQVWLLRT